MVSAPFYIVMFSAECQLDFAGWCLVSFLLKTMKENEISINIGKEENAVAVGTELGSYLP